MPADAGNAPPTAAGKRRQLVVLGMHRSGTSALTGLLSACGLYVGTRDELTEPGAENPKGFFERRDTRVICDALLHAAGADWWRVSDFDVDRIPASASNAQGREIRRVVEFLDAQGPWALKEPRLCLLLPVFRRYLTDPAAAIVYRNPLEVARSLRRRNGFPQTVGLALWEAYVVALLRHSADIPRVFVSFDDLVRDPAATGRTLRADLGAIGVAATGTADANDAIVAAYRHEHSEDDLFERLLTGTQKRLWRYVSTREGDAPDLVLSKEARLVLSEFEADRSEALRLETQVRTGQLQPAEKSEKLAAQAKEWERRAGNAERKVEPLEASVRTLRADLGGMASARKQIELDLARSKAEADVVERRARLAEKRAETLAADNLRKASELAASAVELRDWRARGERFETLQQRLAVAYFKHRPRLERKLPGFAEDIHPLLVLPIPGSAPNWGKLASSGHSAPASWWRRQVGKMRTKLTLRRDVALLRGTNLFDPEWYAAQNPDVTRAGLDPARHYALHGGVEGRDPSPAFSSSWYLSRYEDVRQSGLNPLIHFIRFGRKERRLPLEAPDATNGAKPTAARPAAGSGVASPTPSKGAVPVMTSTIDPARPVADVDIIVPVFNALDDVRRCLSSLRRHQDGLSVRVLVVNDGSDARTGAWLRAYCWSDAIFDLIDLGGNQGYTRAINHGMRASTARYVITLNSDTILTTGWLAGMIRCAESDPGIGIVGPLSNAASWQNVPDLLDERNAFAVNALPADMNADQMARLVASVASRAYPRTPFVNGFCYLIKRGVIDAIGLLDEENFPVGYGEENDYSIRARDAGFDLAIADDAYVYHAKSKSFGHERRTELSKGGSERLKAKHTATRVDALIERVKRTGNVDPVRDRVRDALFARETSPDDAAAMRVLFLLPARGGGGGVHSIVQEVDEMRRMGAYAHVAIRAGDHSDYLDLYRDIPAARELFVPFDKDDLAEIAAAYDVVVATIFTSVETLKSLVEQNPRLVPAYYVQDYEPLFFGEDDPQRAVAETSYELMPGMAVFAKTQWLVDTIRDRHGVEVRKVAPSIDHDVYRPRPETRPNDGRVHVAAMIRPRTPRRGAERTMRVLSRLAAAHGERVAFDLFGCSEDDADFQAIERDFPFRNFGVLSRREVAEVLAASDVFVDLSDYQAFGRTGLEAMACGCAVVVPVQGGTGEYAVDGKNALVVDSLDEDACFAAIEKLVLSPTERLRDLQDAALLAASGFSVRKAAESELAVLRDAFARAGAAG